MNPRVQDQVALVSPILPGLASHNILRAQVSRTPLRHSVLDRESPTPPLARGCLLIHRRRTPLVLDSHILRDRVSLIPLDRACRTPCALGPPRKCWFSNTANVRGIG